MVRDGSRSCGSLLGSADALAASPWGRHADGGGPIALTETVAGYDSSGSPDDEKTPMRWHSGHSTRNRAASAWSVIGQEKEHPQGHRKVLTRPLGKTGNDPGSGWENIWCKCGG